MARPYRLELDSAAIATLVDDSDVDQLLLEAGWGIAGDAGLRARKRTGRGAKSFQPWPGRTGAGPHVDVSWDQDHFYMGFQEWGTHSIDADHALAEAFDQYIHL